MPATFTRYCSLLVGGHHRVTVAALIGEQLYAHGSPPRTSSVPSLTPVCQNMFSPAYEGMGYSMVAAGHLLRHVVWLVENHHPFTLG